MAAIDDLPNHITTMPDLPDGIGAGYSVRFTRIDQALTLAQNNGAESWALTIEHTLLDALRRTDPAETRELLMTLAARAVTWVDQIDARPSV